MYNVYSHNQQDYWYLQNDSNYINVHLFAPNYMYINAYIGFLKHL